MILRNLLLALIFIFTATFSGVTASPFSMAAQIITKQGSGNVKTAAEVSINIESKKNLLTTGVSSASIIRAPLKKLSFHNLEKLENISKSLTIISARNGLAKIKPLSTVSYFDINLRPYQEAFSKNFQTTLGIAPDSSIELCSGTYPDSRNSGILYHKLAMSFLFLNIPAVEPGREGESDHRSIVLICQKSHEQFLNQNSGLDSTTTHLGSLIHNSIESYLVPTIS